MSKIQQVIVAILVIGTCVAVGFVKYPQLSAALAGAPEISKQAEAHILHGDKSGGGHLYGTGKPCKTEFPKDWDESEIIGNVRKVAANDNLKWKKQKNGYYVATDKIEDVKIRVVLDKEKDGVVTAYPVNGKANACSVKASKSAARKKPAATPAPIENAANKQAMPNASNRQPRTHNFNQN